MLLGNIAASVLLKMFMTPLAHWRNSIVKCIQHTIHNPGEPEKI